MVITSMQLQDYRNYACLDLQFDRHTNIFYGNNAQGKTNILEAVYVSGTTRSHRNSKDRELIRFGQEEAHICLYMEKQEILHKIDLHLRKNKTKGIAIDGIPIKKASELFGLLHFVLFSPEDLGVIKNGPSERRRFLDMELCQLDKIYLHHLADYNHVVLQRNKFLKSMNDRSDGSDLLEVLDEQLVYYGREIIKRRRSFIRELKEMMEKIHGQLSGGQEQMEISYESDTQEDQFMEQIKRNRDKDLKWKTTTVGPHRDDISFIVNGADIRRYGSQGQQRTAALSLKLSEIEIVKRRIHDTPVLLLDDVLSELDSSRQNYLLNCIKDVQTLLTCTGLDELIQHRFSINRIYRVDDGMVTAEN